MMYNVLRTQGSVWGLALVLAAASGCGSKPMTFEGQVTWDGRAVDSGTISLAPADGIGPTIGGEVKDGKFRFTGPAGVKTGKKNVTITAVRKTGKQIEAGPPGPPGRLVDELERLTSNDTCELAADKPNQHNFELKSARK